MQKSLFPLAFSFLLSSISGYAQMVSLGWDSHAKPSYETNTVPECTPPENLVVTSIGSDNFKLEWDGPEAPKNGITYQVRYKPMNLGTWNQIAVKEGRSAQLDGLSHGAVYEAEVRKICPSARNEPEMASEWAGIQDILLPSARSISLPSFLCGAAYTPDPCPGNPQNSTAFDTVYIGGIPILVDTMYIGNVSGKQDWFGTGWAPLPFGNQVVRVEWGGDPSNLVSIDENGVFCTGVVKGVSDDPAYWPDLDPGPVPFGGEICLPSNIGNGLPWNDNGFGSDCTYIKFPPYEGYEPGDLIDSTGQLDPWGFDANGIHWETQTTQNPYGCTQEQLNAQPQEPPCDSLPPPYYWMGQNGDPPSQEGNALANEVSDSLEIWLVQILLSLEEEYQDSADVNRALCQAIRDDMNILVDSVHLDYDRSFIFGNDDEYLDEGMHERFVSRPEPVGGVIARDSMQIDLETRHIELYDCDKALHIFIHLVEIFEDLRTNRLDELAGEILGKIETLPSEQALLYHDRDSLFHWLVIQVKLASNKEYKVIYGFRAEKPGMAEMRWAGAPLSFPIGQFLASGDEPGEAFLQSLDLRPEDISFQYLQGWRMINGIHRAYYFDAITNERTMAMTAHDSTLMPILLDNRASDGRLYRVYLDDIVFYTTHATLDAYILLELPNNGQRIVFEAHDIEFGPTGPKLVPLKLELGSDIDVRLSNAAKLIIKGTENTFVSVDCMGFAGIGVEAEIEICRDYVIPIDPGTEEILPEPERVHASFQAFFPTWNDFYLEVTIDPFVVKGVEDVKWHVSQVVVDFSDWISPGSPASPPPGYSNPFAGSWGFSPQWKGFYAGNFSASLPKQFSDGDPVTIGVQDIVIDGMGFSGQIYAAGVLDLSDGNAGGWAFSIDTIDITIIANQLQDAGFCGLIHVPLISNANDCNTGPATAGDCLRYDAFVEPGNGYHFAVFMPAEQYCIDMWKGSSVRLNNNTHIAMKYGNGEFDMLATLYGRVSIKGDTAGSIGFDIGEIVFEKVQLSNKDPYFSPGLWKFPVTLGANLGGFGLTLSNIKMEKTEEGDPALGFTAQLAIVNDEVPLTAAAGFKIVGEKVEYNGRHRWKFRSVKVNKIYVDGSFPGVERIVGILEFFEQDPVYGTGFRGGVGVAFEGVNASVSALAHFGKKSTYKYFFVDALACASIPIAPGLNLTGIGGGVYYHMNRRQSEYSLPACAGPPVIPQQLGVSLSGITYVPDSTRLLGLKATVAMAIAKEAALNVNATFEALFVQTNNSLGFGLERIDFYGNARLLANSDITASPAESSAGTPPLNGASLNANVKFTLNFQNKTLSGDMETFLNTPGNFISGSGPNGRVTQAELYFGPDKWYARMGRPHERNGVRITIPGMKNPIAELRHYLQIGNGGIDPLPDIPAVILDSLGLSEDFPPINNRGSFTHSGAGFIMGADARVDLLDVDIEVAGFNLASAEVYGMLGFDIGILDWGPAAVCAGSGQPLGINGWYAQGQLYAGLFARLSVVGEELASASFAAALQARFPNPFWAKGNMSANVKVGLFNPKVKMEIELGEKCEITGIDNPLVESPLIERVLPANGMVAVSVESNPEVTFIMPIGQEFGLPELGMSGQFTPLLDHAKLYYKSYEIPVQKTWSADKTALTLTPGFFLPSNDTLVLDVLVHIDSSGVNIHAEHRRDTFYTGGAVQKISEDNVAGSYPFDGQFNFYKNEIPNKRGYIQLDKGQPALFFEMEGYKELKVRWKKGGSSHALYLQNADYNAFDNRIEFSIPAGVLENEEFYVVELVRIPQPDPDFGNGSGGISNDTGPAESQELAAEIGHFPIPIPGLPGDAAPATAPQGAQEGYAAYLPKAKTGGETLSSGSPPPTMVVYSIHFRTSRYNTFNEKVAAWTAGKSITSSNWQDFRNEAEMEPFDKYELQGYKASGPLVTATADLNNSWYKNAILPAVYEYFLENNDDILYLDRPEGPLGVPPVNGVVISNDPASPWLWTSPGMAKSGQIPEPAFATDRNVRVSYKLGSFFDTDFARFYWQAVSYAIDRVSELPVGECPYTSHFCECLDFVQIVPQYIRELACSQIEFPQPPSGAYKIFWKYRLPGKEGVHSIWASEVER
jgi:hypothetical protein